MAASVQCARCAQLTDTAYCSQELDGLVVHVKSPEGPQSLKAEVTFDIWACAPFAGAFRLTRHLNTPAAAVKGN